MVRPGYIGAQARALWWRVETWQYRGGQGRDLRLDYLRGFAVFAMIVDHLGSASWFRPLTGGNTFFVSAAEGFVFISGLLVGVVYGDLMRREGWLAAARKALLRARTLYLLAVPLTLLLVAAIAAFRLPFESWYQLDDPWGIAVSVITLQRTFVFADIPLLYTQLLLLAPLCLALLRVGRTELLLALSLALWGVYQIAPDVARRYPWTIEGNWIFHLTSWQLLFVGALSLGYHRDAISRRFKRRPRFGLYFALAAAFVLLLLIYPEVNLDEGWGLLLFDKARLGAGRLVACAIVFPFFYLTLTLFWVPLHRLTGWLLNPLGENSLYSYTLHIFWLVLFYALVPLFGGENNIGLNTALQGGAVLLTRLAIRHRFLFRVIPR